MGGEKEEIVVSQLSPAASYREKSIYFDSLPLSLSAPGSLSYFGLHSVSTGDELGVAPSFFGQPVDEGRTGSPANTKRETPEGQYIKTRVKGN